MNPPPDDALEQAMLFRHIGGAGGLDPGMPPNILKQLMPPGAMKFLDDSSEEDLGLGDGGFHHHMRVREVDEDNSDDYGEEK